jgi:hypothetical protein
MRFEVSYPNGVTHEVAPSGPKAVLGRDPTCDVVLNDTKCSRRHAFVEQSGHRLVVRDANSANGIYVNGRRVDKTVLAPGDTVRLGDVELRVLADLGATVVAAPDDLPVAGSPDDGADAPRSRPPSPAPHPRRAPLPPAARLSAAAAAPSPVAAPRAGGGRVTPSPDAPERPLTITLLAGLWALFVPASVAAVLFGASLAGVGPTGWALAAGASAFLAGLGVAMSLGLRSLAPWAYRMQVATAGVGLAACPFTLASVTVLLYVTRPEVKQVFFAGPRGGSGAGASEPTFALSILAMAGLGLAVSVMAYLVLGDGAR